MFSRARSLVLQEAKKPRCSLSGNVPILLRRIWGLNYSLHGPLTHAKWSPRVIAPQVQPLSAGPAKLTLHSFDQQTRKSPSKLSQGSFPKQTTLDLYSWEMCSPKSDAELGTLTILRHLQDLSKVAKSQMTIVREICKDSLDTLRNDEWVKSNLKVSNIQPSKAVAKSILGDSFIMTDVKVESARNFTTILVSHDLEVTECCDLSYESAAGHRALSLDLPMTTSGLSTGKKAFLHFLPIIKVSSYRQI